MRSSKRTTRPRSKSARAQRGSTTSSSKKAGGKTRDSVRFAKLADLWPKPERLVEALRASSFTDAEASETLLALEASAWKALAEPCAAKRSSATSAHYAYVREAPDAPLTHGFLLVDKKLKNPGGLGKIPHVILSNADAAMDWLLRQLAAPEWNGVGGTKAPRGVTCESGVLIGPHTEIGAGTHLETGVRIGARVKIGQNCRIGAHSRIADDTVLGDGCTLTGSVSLGGQGFGFVQYPGDKRRRPRLHVGRVLIGDHVRLGAFVAVDRGVFEDTQVESGCSFDNIVQVGHNSRVGQDGTLCAFVGLSGSTTIGDRVVIAGMTGTKDHVTIGHDVTIAAQSGVNCDIPDGRAVKGYPPRPLPEALRLQVLLGKLPELFARVAKIEEKK